MKTRAFILAFLLALGLTFAQEEEFTYKEYSYTELFEMIEAEADSVFVLENAIINLDSLNDHAFYRVNPTSEADSALKINRIVYKVLHLKNVKFDPKASLKDIHFKEKVSLQNSDGFRIYGCLFDKALKVSVDDQLSMLADKERNWNLLERNVFLGLIDILIKDIGKSDYYFQLNFSHNHIRHTDRSITPPGSFGMWNDGSVNIIFQHNNGVLGVEANEFHHAQYDVNVFYTGGITSDISNRNFFLSNNVFEGEGLVSLVIGALDNLYLFDNTFSDYVDLSISEIRDQYNIKWTDLQGRLINERSRFEINYDNQYNDTLTYDYLFTNEFTEELAGKYRFASEVVFNNEMLLRGMFVDHYRKLRNIPSANAVYVEMKDIETDRLQYLYRQNPSFDTFFTFKTNQFLRTFSDYGTRPAKAITYSFYVIVIFALFYMLFPSSWDTQGRKRLIDRYEFFFKYLRKDAGIHEVYLESKVENLKDFNAFREYIKDSQQEVPAFFSKTALAIYNWGISGTYLSAKFLSKFDVLKGRWKDLPKSKRIWKSILITGAFIAAIIYDLFIKALNALMLSVNAFTTLGFGEIPIKGVPRYLAIIQGFIGWFMLTIFSVSLISQLLN